jgi:serine/threonine-protein kinase
MTLRQVGNYRLDSLLGRGGMGEVYKAYDTHRDRYVALKLLLEAYSGDREYLQRFRRESYVAARLRDPHVIPIHDFGEIDGQLFIDMRLVDGADIGALLDKDRRIAPERTVHLISQVAEALDAAHADHLVHRDIKPSNVLVTLSDFVYVVDFGIARSVGGRQTPLTHTGAYIGTWDYMAPERFAGQDIDGRADVYSLACLLHECLTGAPPFGNRELYALMYAQLHFDPPEASRLVEGVPPALDAVIARGMAKDPKDRFTTAGALAAAAREALTAEAPAPPPTPELQHTWTEKPDPARQAATAAAASAAPWPDLLEPPDLEPATQPLGAGPEPAGDRAAPRVPYSPTQTATADRVDDAADTRPPENIPQGASRDPDGNGAPPGGPAGGPARGPAWRRLGVPILALVAALAVAIVIVVLASSGKKPGTAAETGTAGAPSSVPRLALPTVAEPVPVKGNPSYVQIAPNGQFAYITNPGSDAIDVLDTATDKVSGTIPIPQGPPQYVSFSANGQTAYVSVYSPSGNPKPAIVLVDTALRKVTDTVPVTNNEPGPSAPSPDGQFLYVPTREMSQGGTGDNVLDLIDLKTNTVQSIHVKANPHWVAVDKETGLVYVTNHMSGVITVLKTGQVIKTFNVVETPHSEALSPDDRFLAVTSYSGDEVYVYSTATDQQVAAVPVGKEPLDVRYSPDGRYLFTVNNLSNTVTVIDTADYRVIDQIQTGKAPTSISILPNGRQAYVTNENSGTIEVLNIST